MLLANQIKIYYDKKTEEAKYTPRPSEPGETDPPIFHPSIAILLSYSSYAARHPSTHTPQDLCTCFSLFPQTSVGLHPLPFLVSVQSIRSFLIIQYKIASCQYPPPFYSFLWHLSSPNTLYVLDHLFRICLSPQE